MKSSLALLFLPLFLLYLAFILIPVIRVLTFTSISYIFSDASSGILQSISYTYVIAFIVSALGILFALPYSFVMSRNTGRVFRTADSLVEIPIMIPHTVVGIMMLITFEPTMPFGKLLAGIIPGYSFNDTLFAVIVTLFFLSSAYSIRTVGISYSRSIVRYEETATTLGISEGKSFFILSVPMLFRPIVRGFILSWARSISEVGSLLIVAYYVLPSFLHLAGVFIYSQFVGRGLYPAAASSAILILTGLLALLILKVVEGKNAEY